MTDDLAEINKRIEQGRIAKSNAVFGFGVRKKHVWRSRLLEEYASAVGLGDVKRDARQWEIAFPRVFSLIDAPEDALQIISEVVQLARGGARYLQFDQAACEHIDMCAEALLNVIATDARYRTKTRVGGRYPTNHEALEIVAAVGLPRLIGVQLPPVPGFKEFRLRHGGRKRRTVAIPTVKEEVAADLTDYLTECYADVGHVLPAAVGDYLGALVGEALANAEEHAGGHDWYVSGYLRKPEERRYGDVHLTFFNFGISLAQSLQGLPAGEQREDLEYLLGHHRRAGYFLARPDWNEAAFWTLQALQEGVSRKSSPTTSRGVGTADMISAFQRLGGTTQPNAQAEMCLLSGGVQILFKPQFPMGMVEMEEGPPRRVIALNQNNDLYAPPAAGCIRPLRTPFPGTLFSLRFYIDPAYLEAIEH